jgi:hypothetical protein
VCHEVDIEDENEADFRPHLITLPKAPSSIHTVTIVLMLGVALTSH